MTLTGSTLLSSGYISNNTDTTTLQLEGENAYLTTNIDALSDLIIVCARGVGQAESVLSSIVFEEYL